MLGHNCGKWFKNPLTEQSVSGYVIMSMNLLLKRGGARQLSLLLPSTLLAGDGFSVLMAHRLKTQYSSKYTSPSLSVEDLIHGPSDDGQNGGWY